MSLAAYTRLARLDPRFVVFGFTMAFASSFGQTYFIGVFGPSIQAEFGLGHTAWGAIYMAGTLASAAVLPFTGKLIDRVDLRIYTALVTLGLAGACALAASASAAWMLVLAIFALRQTGQGLSSHIASTSMVRYFEHGRGSALAVSAVGYAAAEATLPVLVVTLIAAHGWRATYTGAGLVQVLLVLPMVLWLLRGHGARHHAYLARLVDAGTSGAAPQRSWTRADVLRDRRFYLLLPGLLAPSAVVTAMFFHHLTVADAKGWSHAWITGSYAIYAAASVTTSLLAGPIIDRIGAVRLVPLVLSPMIAGLVLLAAFDAAWVVWPYLALFGVCSGLTYTAVSAMWAELYGVEHVGAIRSLGFALSVFGSALGPVAMGALMDAGFAVEVVLLAFAAYGLLGSALMRLALTPDSPRA
ncbi:MAG: MFS transporter [Chromatiales bacterium]|nr:MFS transporter [Chromatiales bacterium]